MKINLVIGSMVYLLKGERDLESDLFDILGKGHAITNYLKLGLKFEEELTKKGWTIEKSSSVIYTEDTWLPK